MTRTQQAAPRTAALLRSFNDALHVPVVILVVPPHSLETVPGTCVATPPATRPRCSTAAPRPRAGSRARGTRPSAPTGAAGTDHPRHGQIDIDGQPVSVPAAPDDNRREIRTRSGGESFPASSDPHPRTVNDRFADQIGP